MKKLIFFFIVLSFLSFGTEKVIIYADQDYPPYTYVENGVLTGIFIDMLKNIDKKIKDFEIVLEPIPWARALKMLESGQAEAILDAWYRPVERPYMIYSSAVINEEIVVATISGKGVNWPKDFINKKIGINRGFSTFKEEDKKLLKIEEANSTEDNILKLSKGRIEYYVNDKYSILWGISNLVRKKVITQLEAKNIKIITSLSREEGYIGYRKISPWAKQTIFIKLVDKEIEKMQKSGELENIIRNYIEN